MRKKILMLASLSLLCGNVFAQTEKNPYVDKMQQEFQQASNQAQAQFEKNYPAPKIAPTPNQKITPSTADAAPAAQTQAQTVPPPVVPTPPKPQAYIPPKQEDQSAAPTKKLPDIAVNPDGSSSTAPNIYAPGGSNSQSNNSTYNPYR